MFYSMSVQYLCWTTLASAKMRSNQFGQDGHHCPPMILFRPLYSPGCGKNFACAPAVT